MDTVVAVEEYEEIEDSEEAESNTRMPKRYIRDKTNPLEWYEDAEFHKRFRFTKNSVLYRLLPKVEDYLVKINNRGLPVPPLLQLLVCLRFYATASFQTVIGDIAGLSQPTVSRIIFRVSILLARFIMEEVIMPTTIGGQNTNRQLFRVLGQGNGATGLADIDGAIDCTHVRLTCTRFNGLDEMYRNRKGYFSLNVQTVVGPHMEFLDIVPEHPGSHHNSWIFQNSRLYRRYREGSLTGRLVGDAGYPAVPFLLTPTKNPQTDDELMYNAIHGRTRQIVDKTYSVWKRRFPVLTRGLSTKLICSTAIVVACAVLHNLALRFHEALPEEDDEPEEVLITPPH